MKERKNEMVRQEAISLQIQAYQIRDCIATVLNGKDDSFTPTPLWDFYPSIFEEDRKEFEKEKERKDIASARSSRIAFSRRHNEALRKKKGGDAE
jgi:hypothetical protein